MSIVVQWSLRCGACGQSRGVYPQHHEPDVAMWPCECGADTSESRWERGEVSPPGRISGFSTSESDFTPHFNRAFGKRVGSLAEMKALQEKHGACDTVVKGDGADRHAPRDILRRVKKHNETREALESGKPIDAGNGVSIRFTEGK